MLDLRYHVASLSAVFLALVVGILVGVGISGRGFVDKSERRNFENRIAALQARADQLTAEKELLSQQGHAAESFVEDTYPVLMRDRLAGKRIAVVVIGPSGGAAGSDVTRALADAGGTTALYRAVKAPVTLAPLRAALTNHKGFRALPDIAHELGQEWVTGGATPVADQVSPLLVEEQRGATGRPIDAVVVIERVAPADGPTERFLSGLLNGLREGGVPLVGAEEVDASPSLVPSWQAVRGMSSVDDVDTPSGKLALVLLLGGAPPGSFGLKPTADAPLPRIEPAA
ncbi:MAG: copper transporter [Actinomycetota bacterium]|nr:copper transporter [Actinomycetota bacterium]